MAQRQSVFRAEYISDHSCGMYQCGEIDSIADYDIKAYLDSYGEYGYQELINFFARSTAAAHSHIMKIRMSKHDGACQAGS